MTRQQSLALSRVHSPWGLLAQCQGRSQERILQRLRPCCIDTQVAQCRDTNRSRKAPEVQRRTQRLRRPDGDSKLPADDAVRVTNLSGYLRSLDQGKGRREWQAGNGKDLRRRDHRI